MTNLQLDLLIAAPILSALVPTITVVISILRSDQKIDALRNDIRADMRILDEIAYDHHGRLSKNRV